jgi:hypothetical protein
LRSSIIRSISVPGIDEELVLLAQVIEQILVLLALEALAPHLGAPALVLLPVFEGEGVHFLDLGL